MLNRFRETENERLCTNIIFETYRRKFFFFKEVSFFFFISSSSITISRKETHGRFPKKEKKNLFGGEFFPPQLDYFEEKRINLLKRCDSRILHLKAHYTDIV